MSPENRLQKITTDLKRNGLILGATVLLVILSIIFNIALLTSPRSLSLDHKAPLPSYLHGFWREIHSDTLLQINTESDYKETWHFAKDVSMDLVEPLKDRKKHVVDRLWTDGFYVDLLDAYHGETYQDAVICVTEMFREEHRLKRTCWKNREHVEELDGVYEKIDDYQKIKIRSVLTV